MKHILKKRGFSLVELLVVVAIMGTLATIAIPAYNNYRQQAKKAAYRADAGSLHKGWLAFGVEIDSFCTRDTNPKNATITNVGMGGLLASPLYGKATSGTGASCVGVATTGCGVSSNPGTPTLQPTGCTGMACTGCTCVGGSGGVDYTAPTPARSGPGRANFIGFGAIACGTLTTPVDNSHFLNDNTATTDGDCSLSANSYKIGSFGHISGSTWIGHQVESNGVITEVNNLTSGAFTNVCTS